MMTTISSSQIAATDQVNAELSTTAFTIQPAVPSAITIVKNLCAFGSRRSI